MATALAGASTSLQIATDKNWISNDTAAKAYAFLLSQLGTDVEPDEKRKITEEMNLSEFSNDDQSVLSEAMDILKKKKNK